MNVYSGNVPGRFTHHDIRHAAWERIQKFQQHGSRAINFDTRLWQKQHSTSQHLIITLPSEELGYRFLAACCQKPFDVQGFSLKFEISKNSPHPVDIERLLTTSPLSAIIEKSRLLATSELQKPIHIHYFEFGRIGFDETYPNTSIHRREVVE